MSIPFAISVPGGLSLALGSSYLLGAIPFGLIMAKAIKGIDLRTVGSGNIGATNAMRVLGKPLGLVAFLLDWAKGFAASYWLWKLAGGQAGLSEQVLCGAASVVGHCFPVYLRFRGGKGVATASGSIVAIDPIVFVFGGLVWLGFAFGARYVSLASMAMGITFPIAAYVRWGQPGWPLVAGLLALMVLILVRHKANVARLLQGTEPKMGAKKHKGDSDRG